MQQGGMMQRPAKLHQRQGSSMACEECGGTTLSGASSSTPCSPPSMALTSA